MSIRAISYARQSLTEEHELGQSNSIAVQHQQNELTMARDGAVCVARYHDEDTSGTVASRVALDRMLDDIKRLRPDRVYVYNISRFVREIGVYVDLRRQMAQYGVALHSATENIDDPTIATILVSIAEMYVRQLARNVALSHRRMAELGSHRGPVPYGYARIERRLVIDEAQAPAVRLIYDRFDRGERQIDIARELRGNPLYPPATRWGRAARDVEEGWPLLTIKRILTSEVYTGTALVRPGTDRFGQAYPGVRTEDAHPAIIERAQWERVQARFQAAPARARWGSLQLAWLADMAYCADCGHKSYLQNNKRWYNFRCGRYLLYIGGRAGENCPNPHRQARLADVLALARERLIADLSGVGGFDDVLAQAQVRRREDARASARDQVLARLTALDGERERLLELYLAQRLDAVRWAERDGRYADQRAGLEAQLADLPAELPVQELRAAHAWVASVAETLAYADDDLLRTIAVRLGGRLMIRFHPRTPEVWWEYGGVFGELLRVG